MLKPLDKQQNETKGAEQNDQRNAKRTGDGGYGLCAVGVNTLPLTKRTKPASNHKGLFVGFVQILNMRASHVALPRVSGQRHKAANISTHLWVDNWFVL